MSDCCSPKATLPLAPKRHVCPANRKEYAEVPFATILHHLKTPWKVGLVEQTYYFCDDANCDVVYFGIDNTMIRQEALRTEVGIKTKNDDALTCYCFDVSHQQARDNPAAKTFVIEQTKHGRCSCATSNPSGKCCLKDFP